MLAALIGTKNISEQNSRPSFLLRNSSPINIMPLLFYLCQIHLLVRPKQKVVLVFSWTSRNNLHWCCTLS